MARESLASVDGDSIASAVLSALNHRDRRLRARIIDEASRAADPDSLVRAVGDHADAVKRNAAMDALVRGGTRSVPALVRALDDPDREVVMFAATVLGKTRDREAIPYLLRVLDSGDVNIATAAIESLGHLRATAAVEPLLGLLERDPWLRLGAIHALGEIGDPRAADPLAATLGDDTVWDLAVGALGKVRSPRAVDHLAGALWDGLTGHDFAAPLRAMADALRRQPAIEPLWQLPSWARLASDDAASFRDRLRGILEAVTDEDEDESKIELAEAAAMLVRSLRLEALYGALVRSARSAALRPALQFWTLAIGPQIAGALAEAMSDSHVSVRILACQCAGALRLPSLAQPLVGRLTDEDRAVRHDAVRALMHLGAPETTAALAERLLDPDLDVRSSAQQALSSFEPEAASQALLAFPRRDPAVAAAMLHVMRVSPHPSQLPFLFDCLRSEHAELRRLTVEALADQTELDVVDVLAPVLGDPDSVVRASVIRVLGRRRTARVSSILLEHLGRETSDIDLLVRTLVEMHGASIGPRLIDAYVRQPGLERLAILEALAGLREPAAEPLIVELLASDDAELRRRAVTALAQVGSAVAIRHILAASTDPAWQVRASVAEALGAIDGAAASDELEKLCLDAYSFVAVTARHALEVRGRGE